MKLPISWLREYVDFKLTPQQLADELMLSGTAVESLKKIGSGNKGVIVGEVLSVDKHPNADKLSVCQVAVPGKLLTIVCGAPNVKEGIKVLVALPGAKLKTGLEVGQRKIRGIESSGMICSQAELEIGDDDTGIYVLPESAETGKDMDSAIGLSDWVIEFEITPNRPDCMSVIGIAREVSAITGNPLKMPTFEFVRGEQSIKAKTEIEVRDTELCPRYIGMIIDGITIGESPAWMKQRLSAAGMRPINNAVDVTNYVLLETGQPLHAFDWKLLRDHKIIVRRATKNEKITTLDGVERKLDSDVLVIADGSNAVAIAGVMGSENSEVRENTQTILLEAAYFKPQSIMSTARKLGLLTESAARFERGIDPNNTEFAAVRAMYYLQIFCGGKILGGKIDIYPEPMKPRSLELRCKRLNSVLGTTLNSDKIMNRLESLGLQTEEGKESVEVIIPTSRRDLEREIDLIEEVARLEKYDSIHSTLPKNDGSTGGLTKNQKLLEKVETIMTGEGLWEAMTYSLISRQMIEDLYLHDDDARLKFVTLKNPLSDELAVLRTSLLPGLLQSARHNIFRSQPNVQLYERGKIFRKKGSSFAEQLSVAIVVTGSWYSKNWWGSPEAVTFFDLKGIVEQILTGININNYDFKRSNDPVFHPGISIDIYVKKKLIGSFGQLHPDIASKYDLPPESFGAEIDVSALLASSEETLKFVEIPRFPSVERDIALLTDKATSSSDVISEIKKHSGDLLANVGIFDQYMGKNVPEGKKSLAFSLEYRSDERTLIDEEVDKIQDKIIKALSEKGYQIR